MSQTIIGVCGMERGHQSFAVGQVMQEVRQWKTKVDLDSELKKKKLDSLSNVNLSQQDCIIQLHYKNEQLRLQLENDADLRSDAKTGIEELKREYFYLAKHLDDAHNQAEQCFKLKEAIDEHQKSLMAEFKDFIRQHDDLKTLHLEKLALFEHEANIMKYEQENSLMEQEKMIQTLNREFEVKIDEMRQKTIEINEKWICSEKEKNEVIVQKNYLEIANADAREHMNSLLMEIDEMKAGKEEDEKNQQSVLSYLQGLQEENCELKGNLNDCQIQHLQSAEEFNKKLEEVQKHFNIEQKKYETANELYLWYLEYSKMLEDDKCDLVNCVEGTLTELEKDVEVNTHDFANLMSQIKITIQHQQEALLTFEEKFKKKWDEYEILSESNKQDKEMILKLQETVRVLEIRSKETQSKMARENALAEVHRQETIDKLLLANANLEKLQEELQAKKDDDSRRFEEENKRLSEDLNTQICVLECSLSLKNMNNDDLQNEVTDLKKENASLHDQYKATLEEKRELEAKLDDHAKMLEEEKTKFFNIKNDLQAQQTKCEELELSLTDFELKSTQHNSYYDILKKENEEILRELNEKTRNLHTKETDCEQLECTLSDLNQMLVDQKKEYDSLNEEHQIVLKELSTLKTGKTLETDGNTRKIHELQGNLSIVNNWLEESKSEIDRLKNDLEMKDSSLKSMSAEACGALKMFERKDEDCCALSTKNMSLERKLQDYESITIYTTINEELPKSLKKRVAVLEKWVINKQILFEKSEKENSSLLAENAELKQQLELGIYDDLEKENSELKKQNKNFLNNWMEQDKNSNIKSQKILSLQQELEILKQNFDYALEKSKRELQKKNHELQNELGKICKQQQSYDIIKSNSRCSQNISSLPASPKMMTNFATLTEKKHEENVNFSSPAFPIKSKNLSEYMAASNMEMKIDEEGFSMFSPKRTSTPKSTSTTPPYCFGTPNNEKDPKPVTKEKDCYPRVLGTSKKKADECLSNKGLDDSSVLPSVQNVKALNKGSNKSKEIQQPCKRSHKTNSETNDAKSKRQKASSAMIATVSGSSLKPGNNAQKTRKRPIYADFPVIDLFDNPYDPFSFHD